MRVRYVLTAASLSLLLGACGEEDETVQDPAPAEDTEQTEDQPADDTGNQEDTGISFLEFDMDADYEGNDNDFELSYDAEGSEIEASYENERDMLTMSGDDAFQEIQPVLSEFEFTTETPDDEVIDRVIEGFEVEEGFQSIEIEIKFEDGTEKEYNRGN
ncbi:YusW family protein [Jeotgalibacillus haloalkalitolerans]|uniref:YusW family protein n=1 Tax=Jeotgalibacillus haloalkalitolerans TaxID=3104292 RepID=A0ABU5KMD9_9BACL|nr:YusW family protein [Jeotgalibacillus sp. HH7-29]MDZ5712430.1 YusW family protein [Jeotgalibacillus sp. HH7-29]